MSFTMCNKYKGDDIMSKHSEEVKRRKLVERWSAEISHKGNAYHVSKWLEVYDEEGDILDDDYFEELETTYVLLMSCLNVHY